MAIKIQSSTFNGIEGVLVNVEVDINRGLPAFSIVGLADISIRESKERVKSAIINSGFKFPLGKITINLAPADLRKEGALLDLPIAIGILAATEQIEFDNTEEFIFVGELSLNGNINRIKGALPIIIEGIKNGINEFIVPTGNANECCAIDKAKIYPFGNLIQVASFLKYRDVYPYKNQYKSNQMTMDYDFSEVVGQKSSKRALEIACSGNHNVVIFGPPGCGKSMLASRIPSILPNLTYEESLEITKVYSISGNLTDNNGLILQRPFRNPHHSSSRAALIGGGNRLLPGEISLSHHGVLFLDELLEFKKSVLEVLREPLESKSITISRCNGTVVYPANFMLIGSLNPCPCGYYLSGIKECTCTDFERTHYLSKLSGPFLDRIDIFTFAYQHNYEEMVSTSKEESSLTIKNRVEAARDIQRERFKKDKIYCNSDMTNEHLKKYCNIHSSAQNILKRYFEKFPFSMRTYNRILKIGRTIADMECSDEIKSVHIVEAINYRQYMNGKVI